MYENIQATSAAITKAFQTPSIIKMFAKNEPNALKDKRNQIERNMKLGKLSLEVGNRQKVCHIFNFILANEKFNFFYCIYVYVKQLEVLTALRHLGCQLSDSDKIFIREETSKLQSDGSSVGFNITDSLNGFGACIILCLLIVVVTIKLVSFSKSNFFEVMLIIFLNNFVISSFVWFDIIIIDLLSK